MASTNDRPPDRDASTAVGSYWSEARRPIQILAFLLPLIVAYELCLALVLPADDGQHVNTVEAHKTLLAFFRAFGIAPTGGLYLGGLVIVVVLLVWHVLTRDRWRIDPMVVAYMGIEAILLAIPLLVLGHLAAQGLVAAAPSGPEFRDLGVLSQMAISVGAGLYEELLFRMILIALIHTLLVDMARTPPWVGSLVAITVAAAAFTWYHDLDGPDGRISPRKTLFYFGAGLYLGLVFLTRGFGLAVGVHAIYDIITVLMPGGSDDG
jgi:hypothetical protein